MRAHELWTLREQLREHRLAPKRVRHCGRTAFRREVALTIKPGAAWWDGVVRCRTRTCPVCWVTRRARAAEAIKWVTDSWIKDHPGRPTYLTTFTVRHQAGDPVTLARDVRRVWRSLLQRRMWRDLASKHGAQWIAAEEVTSGENGWHPHIHCFVLVKRAFADYLATADALYEQWAELVERKLGAEHTPSPHHGVDLRPCPASLYLSKLGIELADSGAIKGRAPLAMLGEGQIDRYMELQISRTRARDITFSRGLREIREAQPNGAAEGTPTIEVRGSHWYLLARGAGGLAPLEVASASSPEEMHARLRHYLGPLHEHEFCDPDGVFLEAAE